MHLQARIYIKSALAYLLIASLVGSALLANQGLHQSDHLWVVLPVYYHLLTVGWLTQLICGVALWMFPPLSRERPRGNERQGWVAYGTLNLGLLLRAVAEPLFTLQPQYWLGWMLALSAFLQMIAIWLLVFELWPRVRGRTMPASHLSPEQLKRQEA